MEPKVGEKWYAKLKYKDIFDSDYKDRIEVVEILKSTGEEIFEVGWKGFVVSNFPKTRFYYRKRWWN